jgi:hypothetical protein
MDVFRDANCSMLHCVLPSSVTGTLTSINTFNGGVHSLEIKRAFAVMEILIYWKIVLQDVSPTTTMDFFYNFHPLF